MLRPHSVLWLTLFLLYSADAKDIFSVTPYPSLIKQNGLSNFVDKPFPNLDTTRQLCLINEAHGTQPSNLPRNSTGKNVLVGIIDTEFDTHHPAFVDHIGETRFIALWDQDNSSIAADNRFGYGVIKNHAELQQDSLFGLRENQVHGTMMASILAGSEKTYGFYGVATDAMIAAVKYSDAVHNISDGISWIFSLADSLNLPCVINLSIGISQGPHDGTSIFDRFVDSISGPGRIVIGAAGNDYARGAHTLFRLSPYGSGSTWMTPKTYSFDSDTSYTSGIDIWGEQSKSFSVLPLVIDTASKVRDTFKRVTTNRATKYEDKMLWRNSDGSTDIVNINIGTEVSSLNNKPHCKISIQTTNPDLFAGVTIINSSDSSNIHAWHTSKMALRSFGMSGFQDGNTECSVNEIGGTAKRIITVGSYFGRASLKYWNDSIEVVTDHTGDITHFSGTGPTVDGRIKPDIVAPGMRIVVAMSRNSPPSLLPVVWPDITRTTGRYTEATGTSGSAPIVAGIIALMLEINPLITPEIALQCIRKSALLDQYTGNILTPINRWGAGKINAAGAIQEVINISTVTREIRTESRARISLFQYGRTVFIKNLNQTGSAILFNLHGRKISKFQFDESGTIAIPHNIAAGIFTITAYRQNGTAAGNFKIVLDR